MHSAFTIQRHRSPVSYCHRVTTGRLSRERPIKRKIYSGSNQPFPLPLAEHKIAFQPPHKKDEIKINYALPKDDAMESTKLDISDFKPLYVGDFKSDREIFEELKKVAYSYISDSVALNGSALSWLNTLERAYSSQGRIFTSRQKATANKIISAFYTGKTLDLHLPDLLIENKVNRNEVRRFLDSIKGNPNALFTLSYITEHEKKLFQSYSQQVDYLNDERVNRVAIFLDLIERRQKLSKEISSLDKDTRETMSEEELDKLMWVLEESLDINWHSELEIFYDDLNLHFKEDHERDLLWNIIDRAVEKFGDEFTNKLLEILDKKPYVHHSYNQEFCTKLLKRISSPSALDYLFDGLSNNNQGLRLVSDVSKDRAREALGFTGWRLELPMEEVLTS